MPKTKGKIDLYLAKQILTTIKKHQKIQRGKLEFIVHVGSACMFHRAFTILKNWNLLEKTGTEKRAPYQLTEKGQSMLEALGE